MNSLNQAYQLFIDEVPELLQDIENGLLNLPQDRSTSVIHGMMRSAHSLKGGAASVGLQGIKNIAHKLEDYLKALYNEDLVIDEELEDLFLQGFDCLAMPLRQQLETGDFDRASAQNKAELVWQKLETKLGNAREKVEDYLPSSADLGIDIVASIFEVDIAQEIRRLKGVVASPDNFNPLQELTESLEILQGLGEVVNLPGFSLIVSMAQQALEKHPDKTIVIAGLLVQDLEESRTIVLGGDRTSGGNPCSNLLALAEDNQAQVEAKVLHDIAKSQQNTVSVEDPVYQFFMAEVPDLLHDMETGLLALKEDKSINNINDIMRSAHSLKGGAASVGLDGIKDMAHKLEDYIKALFDESVIVDDELESLFLSGFDCLKNALEEQKNDGNYSLQWQEEALLIWQQLEERLGNIDNGDYLPSSADLGIDIMQSLFEIDIARIIEQIQENLATLTPEELTLAVTPLLEVLIGFSEIGNMKGLKAIADTTSVAIKENPNKINTIINLLIQDLTQAREDVLSGNATEGGKPSPELRQLAHHENHNHNEIGELVEGDNLFHPEELESSGDESLFDFAELASEINDSFDSFLQAETDNETDNENRENIFDTPLKDDFVNFAQERENWVESEDLNSFNLDNSEENIFASFNEDNLSQGEFSADEEDIFANFNQDNHPLVESPLSEEDIFANFGEDNYSQVESTSDEDIFMDNLLEEEDNNHGISEQQRELQAQSYLFFMEEAVELIALIDDNLETVFETRNINDINEVARAAHSLKGGSRSAGLEDIGMIALRVEKSLKALFNENIPLDETRKTNLRDIYQTLRQAIVARMESQPFDEKSAMERVNAQWDEFEAEYGEEIAKSEEYLPSSSDLGIDIATSIFEVDVPEGIANLQQALDSGDEIELQDMLSMQIEVFSGFGEMLALPGFTAICETANKALTNNPSQITAITQAFINNLQEAHTVVMGGDRTSGGQPSTELLILAGETPSIIESREKPIDTSDQAYGFFIEEAPELLQIIESGLLTLREDRNTAKIHEIMRAAHSIKGGAASVGLEAIKTISHQLEDVFKVLYNPDIDIDTDLESWLLEGFDCLQNALTTQLETGTYEPQEALEEASQIWAKINTKLGGYLDRADDYIPSSSDLGVDMVQSMFDIDVEEELQRLKTVLANPSSQPLAGELRATLEVFCGFGEMLNLPGFAEIAQLGLQAADANPDHLLTIINVIIRDAEQARSVVLRGDRTRGGEPSEELKRLARGESNLDTEDHIFYLDNSESITDDEPSLNDVFSEVLATPEEIFPVIEKDTQTVTPPLEDVFFSDLDPIQLEALDQGIADEEEEETPNLEEIFASEFSEEEINLLANASELALEDDKNNTIPSLEDVFAINNGNIVNSSEDSNSDDEEEEIPLDDVFANPDLDELMETDEEIETQEDIMTLSQIFSNVELPPEIPFTQENDTEGNITPENQIVDDSQQAKANRQQIIFQKIKDNVVKSQGIRNEITSGNEGEEIEIPPFPEEVDNEDNQEIPLDDVFNNPDFDEVIETDEEIETQEDIMTLSQIFSNVELPPEIPFSQENDTEGNITPENRIVDDSQQAKDNRQQIIFQKIKDTVVKSQSIRNEITSGNEGEEIEISPFPEEVDNEDNQEIPLDDVFNNPDFDEVIETDEEIETEEDIMTLSQIFSNVELPPEIPFSQENDTEKTITPENRIVDYSQQTTEVGGGGNRQQAATNVSENQIVEEVNLVNEEEGENLFALPPEVEEIKEVEMPPLTEKVDSDTIKPPQIEANIPQDTHKQTLINLSPEEREMLLKAKGENIDETIQSIANIYDKLPGLKTSDQLKVTSKNGKSAEKTAVTPSSPPKPATPSPKSNLTIRVDLDRLERMNNLMGELSINRNGLSLQNNKLQNAVKELVERFANFQQMANNLRDISDKMLVSPEKFATRGRNVNKTHDRVDFSLASLASDDDDLSLHSAFDALEMDRYDNLYNITQGLIEQMIQLEEAVDDIALYAGQSGNTVENQRQMLNRLRDELMWARMLPLGEILNRFPRVLRDLSVKYNKKVNLKLSGTSVLVDKAALEKLYDPLVHLIRNAFDHGIETPELRKQKNKSEIGTIEVKAYHQGNQTIIEIRDDGGGLNLQKIGQKAVEKQLLTPEQLAVITKENLLDLIFEPGFSTASAVTEISGRGVGLDIVRSQLRSLKGTISVDSEPNVGSTFIMKLPLTLTIDKLLVLSAGIHFYALPSDNIAEIVVPESHQIKTSGNQRFLHYENKVVPIYPLTDLLQYRCYLSDTPAVNQSLEILPTPEEWGKPLLLIYLGQELFAMEVDHLVSEQELVIKPFGTALTAPSYTYGCTILGDGTLIPVINTTILLANHLQVNSGVSVMPRRAVSASSAMDSLTPSKVFQVSSVLVVDDSAAMRRTLALSLEKAGYRVIQAKDGKDAIEQLQQGLNVSLIICDIEMPNMNGFEFLGQRRRYPEFNKVPVAMLTSRSNDKHRKLATHLGANAYFTKPYIEQKFLESIRNLVEGQKTLVNA